MVWGQMRNHLKHCATSAINSGNAEDVRRAGGDDLQAQ